MRIHEPTWTQDAVGVRVFSMVKDRHPADLAVLPDTREASWSQALLAWEVMAARLAPGRHYPQTPPLLMQSVRGGCKLEWWYDGCECTFGVDPGPAVWSWWPPTLSYAPPLETRPGEIPEAWLPWLARACPFYFMRKWEWLLDQGRLGWIYRVTSTSWGWTLDENP